MIVQVCVCRGLSLPRNLNDMEETRRDILKGGGRGCRYSQRPATVLHCTVQKKDGENIRRLMANACSHFAHTIHYYDRQWMAAIVSHILLQLLPSFNLLGAGHDRDMAVRQESYTFTIYPFLPSILHKDIFFWKLYISRSHSTISIGDCTWTLLCNKHYNCN